MDCNTNFLGAAAQIQTLLRTDLVSKISGFGIKLVPFVALDFVPALNCDNSHLTFEQLFLLSIGINGCDLPALRVTIIESCDQLKDCQNNNFDFLNSMFAYNTVTKEYVLVLVNETP